MAVLSDEQFETLTRALGDAADYRNGGEECVDCDELEPELCEDHKGDAALATSYNELQHWLVITRDNETVIIERNR